MKILTQNLKTGKTNILEVPSPSKDSNKIRVTNEFSLISTGTESLIVNFGRASWLNKAKQQPDRVKDVINKIKASGISQTYKAIKNKLNLPMPMGYSAVGIISHDNKKYNLSKGTRVFTNSYHQEEALVDYNMCVEVPKNLDSKSASFGAIGGIAMQSIKCIPEGSKSIAIIGLGLLGQVTFRILNALGYDCIVYDIDKQKVHFAIQHGAKGIQKKNIKEIILNHTKGVGVDCTIIAASSLSNNIINEATYYTKRKGKIISSGLVGLNLIRDNFFKKQIELVISNSSGDKTHRGKGSSYENISYFFELLSSQKMKVFDLISEEISFNESDKIYSFPKDSIFFSKIIKYERKNKRAFQTLSDSRHKKNSDKISMGLIGTGNFALSTFIPTVQSSQNGYLLKLLGREGLSLYIAKKRFNIDTITTDKKDFYDKIDSVCIATPHETHFNLLNKSIELSLSTWIEKPLVISNKELIAIRKKMLTKKLVYAVGYNRSLAPWTKFITNKINSKKTKIAMTINAGELPSDHWLLNQNICGGRILGEFCHFIDLSLTMLKHTNLINIECIHRDKHYQDTGKFILNFEDGSTSTIDYRYDLAPNIPKEKVVVEVNGATFINNNWRKFSSSNIFNANLIKKGKGHKEAINSFFLRIKNKEFSTETEINEICLSTFVSIRLQRMSSGDKINIIDDYKDKVLSKV